MNSFVLPVLIELLAEQGISKTQLLENTDLEGFEEKGDVSATRLIGCQAIVQLQ